MIRELDRQARVLEQSATQPLDFDEHVARERRASPSFGGRTV